MNDKDFLVPYEIIKKKLVGLEVNRVLNSIGSNVFFEFGQGKEVTYRNGKTSVQKEWSIWLSDASWRLSKKGKYIVGSWDLPGVIEPNIQKLLGKRFQSIQFLSQFLDTEFNFDDDYRLTTFFNWIGEDQWMVFTPDSKTMHVDCSDNQTIKNTQNIAAHFPIVEDRKKLEIFDKALFVNKVAFDERGQPIFYLENDISIYLENCSWRLEKAQDYVIGCLDENSVMLDRIIGKKLTCVDLINSMMDARFQFEDGYVLKTFTCWRRSEQWQILKKSIPIFQATIKLLED